MPGAYFLQWNNRTERRGGRTQHPPHCPGVIHRGFDPTNGFKIGDFAKIPLSGRQVRVSENYLRDNFDRSPGSRRECSRVPSKVMRFEIDADQFSGLSNHDSHGGIGNREYPVGRFNPVEPDIFPSTDRRSLWGCTHTRPAYRFLAPATTVSGLQHPLGSD